jgi:hypothetical protein
MTKQEMIDLLVGSMDQGDAIKIRGMLKRKTNAELLVMLDKATAPERVS